MNKIIKNKSCVIKHEGLTLVYMKNNYFAKAKAAAKKNIADVSAAHSAAMKVLREMVPGKPEAFYGDMGFQAVLAAR